jgi:hypothetical protein
MLESLPSRVNILTGIDHMIEAQTYDKGGWGVGHAHNNQCYIFSRQRNHYNINMLCAFILCANVPCSSPPQYVYVTIRPKHSDQEFFGLCIFRTCDILPQKWTYYSSNLKNWVEQLSQNRSSQLHYSQHKSVSFCKCNEGREERTGQSLMI